MFALALIAEFSYAAQWNSIMEESRALIANTFSFTGPTQFTWTKIVTDQNRNNLWLLGYTDNASANCVIAKSDHDMNLLWAFSTLDVWNEKGFMVTPDGNYLIFSEVSPTLFMFVVNATDGTFIAKIESPESFDSGDYLYAHPDSRHIYFELQNSIYLVCKLEIGGTNIDCYHNNSIHERVAIVPMIDDYLLIVYPFAMKSNFCLQAIDFSNSGASLWKKQIDCPSAPLWQYSQSHGKYYNKEGESTVVLMTMIDFKFQIYFLNAINGDPKGTSYVGTQGGSGSILWVEVLNDRAYFLYFDNPVSAWKLQV
jgi:hypothetical protein